MSLIHEALKRAEADKMRRSPYFNNLTVIPPAEDEVPPPPRPVFVEPPRAVRRRLPTVKILATVLVVATGVGGWYLWKQYRGRLGIPAVAVAQDATSPTGLATALATPPQPPWMREAPAAPAAPPPAPSPAPSPAKPVVQAAPPAPAARAAAVIVDVPPPPPPPPAAETVAMAENPAPTPAPAPVPTPTPAPDATAPDKAQALRKAPAASRAGRKPATKLAPANANAGRFTLSAIGRGPEGSNALINERVVQEGQTVLDATVVKIGPTWVELEVDGARFTIRL